MIDVLRDRNLFPPSSSSLAEPTFGRQHAVAADIDKVNFAALCNFDLPDTDSDCDRDNPTLSGKRGDMAARSRGQGWWEVCFVLACLGIVVMHERSTTRPQEPSEQQPAVADELTVALEPLNRSVLVRRAVDIFPAGYLMIISIIQGVALSVLLAETVPLVIDGGRGTAAVVATFAQALLAFVAIVVVAYEYLWFTTLMRWVPTFRDTLVPLLLGVGEIVPAFLMERWTAWWVVMTIFIGLGGGAYLNTITRLRRELFAGDDQIRRRVSGLLWQLVAQCAAGVLFGVVTWQVVRAWPGSAAVVTTMGATALVVLIGVGMVFVSERVLNEVFKRHGIQRRPLRPTWEHTGWMSRD